MIEAIPASESAPTPVASGPVPAATGNDFQKEVDKKKAAASGSAPDSGSAPSASGDGQLPEPNTLSGVTGEDKPSASGGAPSASGDGQLPEPNTLSGVTGEDKPSASGGASSASGDGQLPESNTLAGVTGEGKPSASGGASDPDPRRSMPQDIPPPVEYISEEKFAENTKLIDETRGKGGKEILKTLEDVGYLSIQGDFSEEIRSKYVEIFDKSPFLEKYVLDYFSNRRNARGVSVSVKDLDGGRIGAAGREIHLDDSLFNGENPGASLAHVIAHETLHIAGFQHSPGMNTAMAIFSSEYGMFEEGMDYNPDLVGDSFNYDLFLATKKDWNSVGAGSVENKDAFDVGYQKLFGDKAGSTDPNVAFSKSAQSFNRDVPSIAQAYLDALDGGEVEKIRAKQLQDLGIDPEALKGTDGHLNSLVSYYHENISIPNRTVPSLTDEARGMFENLLQHYYIFENPKGDTNDAVTWVLDQINGRLPGTYPDGEANTYWDERDDGVEATVILSNYYTKHSGGEYLRDVAESVRNRVGVGAPKPTTSRMS